MKYEKLAESILALLSGMDLPYKMYKGRDGKRTSNPYDARYFYVSEPNLMFIIDEPTNTLSVHKASMKFTDFKPIHQAIRELARRYFINLETRDYNKSFSPRDFSPILMKKEMRVDQINESTRNLQLEKIHRYGNILEIIESGGRVELILNGEDGVCLPYRKEAVIDLISEHVLRHGNIDNAEIIRIYQLHEKFTRIERKVLNATASKNQLTIYENYRKLF